MSRFHRTAALARLVAPFLLALSGCNTVNRGTTQTVTVLTVPEGASCTVERGRAALGTVSPTPGALEVRRAPDDLAVSCTKDGYKPARVTKSAMNTRMLGGASALSDMASGANYSYPPRITVHLDPAPVGTIPRR